MKGKKIVVLVAAIFAIVSFAGVALAVDRVEVNITSEPIQKNAACDKAGGISMEFDAGTIITGGDKFTLDLDYGVTLCNDIDIVLAPLNDIVLNSTKTAVISGTGWTCDANNRNSSTIPYRPTATNPLNRLPSPVVINEDSPTGAVNTVSTGGGVIFHIFGSAKSARVTVDILSVNGGTIKVGGDPEDVVTIYFFDQKTNPLVTTDYDHYYSNPSMGDTSDGMYSSDGAWILDPNRKSTDPMAYKLDAQVVNNTYCINASAFDGYKIEVNIDSKNDKYTVDPSNPQVATIISALDMKLFECKTRKIGSIKLGVSGSQTDTTCPTFDAETSTNFCTDNPGKVNKLVIENVSGTFDFNGSYEIALEILVNDRPGDNGVYFSNSAVKYGVEDADYTTSTCAFTAGKSLTTASRLLASGTKAEAIDNNGTCVVEADQRAVTIKTEATRLFADNSENKYIYIDVPSFAYQSDLLEAGDEVKVKVSLTKTPCGTIFTGDHTIGVFGCEAVTDYKTLVYPYFGKPMSAGGYFYNGLVITNLSSKAGKVVFFLYEQDGDKYKIELGDDVTVPGHGVYQTTLSQLAEVGTATVIGGSSGDGTVGNSKGYVVACTAFISDGFALIGNASTGESTGYLPRSSTLPKDSELSTCTTLK